MKTSPSLVALLVSLAVAAPLGAQDSVAKAPHMVPGDSINAYETGEQINDYIVDLTPFQSSWGNTFGIAPLVKASQNETVAASAFFTHLQSGNGMSKDTLADTPFARNSYMTWSGQGLGVRDNATYQDPGPFVSTQGMTGRQFGIGVAEFGGQISKNNLIGGVVNYEAGFPGRMYVSRIVGSTNAASYNCNVSQLGFGGVDADGNAAIRVDGFGSADCEGGVVPGGNNIYRIDLLARTLVLNVIDNSGGTDAAATEQLVSNNGTVQIVPSVIPESIAGRSIVIGTTFADEYSYEAVPGAMVFTTAHTSGLGLNDTRGNLSYAPLNSALLGASVNGTAALLGRNAASQVVHLVLWGLSANGSVTGNLRLDLPAVLVDNDDAWPSNALGAGQIEFTNHSSQTSFRGGNGQVAMGRDQAGRMLVAATVDHPLHVPDENNHPTQLIAVARENAAGGFDWAIAAHNDNSMGMGGGGKAIKDGPGGAVVGRLISLFNVAGGFTGPSCTSPMMDSVGNIYFTAALEIFDPAGGPSNPGTGLVKAVYHEATFSYELELLFDTGDSFVGVSSVTSTTPYQIRFLEINDSNSVGSAATYSGSISANASDLVNPAALDTSDPRTLGGLSIAARVVWDVDGDGDFELQDGVSQTTDEDYRVMMYVGASADCNGNGVDDGIDILDGTSLDLNGDGVPDECAGTVGSNYCLSVPNSTGAAAGISAFGSSSIAANDLTLVSQPWPTQPGIFIAGPGQAQIPFFNGFLCVNPVGLQRFFDIALPVGGVISETVDYGTSAAGGLNVRAGSSYNYQRWNRDPVAGGGNANFSNGLEVLHTL